MALSKIGSAGLASGAVSPAAVSDQANTSTGYLDLPAGTTAQRPVTLSPGIIRYNSDLDQFEMSEGTKWVVVKGVFAASGGTETTYGGYKYHTFLSSGTFTVDKGDATVEYLVVAGGGSAGSYGGGGGAGGLITGSLAIGVGTYPIVVGAGGTHPYYNSSTNVVGVSGSNSIALGLTAIGGGGGGHATTAGLSGGSGGGGGYASAPGSGTSGQGYAGGSSMNSNPYGNGGGGGAGGVGVSVTNQYYSGGGGPGLQFSDWATATSTGDSGYYAGGGAGGVAAGSGYNSGGVAATGGPGGGGNGGVGGVGQTNGDVNTGGGGGAGAYHGSSNLYFPRNGGSGIVIIRYAI